MSGKSIAIIGGGVAGATTAVHLAELGVNVTLIEKGAGLVNGPPICHLHAGGNLYREISTEQCIELLIQSINTLRMFPHTINHRPTVVAIPVNDRGEPQDLIPRLEQIRDVYQQLVEQDAANEVLGSVEQYFQTFSKSQLLSLKGKVQPQHIDTIQDWLIPFANQVDLDKIKYPVIAVQEHGWSVFRLGASASLALDKLSNCEVKLNSAVESISATDQGWQISYRQAGQLEVLDVDYLINAAGFKTGVIDDMVEQPRQRLVEFKAAYVTQWTENRYQWPEVIFHGERGTPNGMAQLTPYADNHFQLHGMTKDITLFEGGLAQSSAATSQPQLPAALENKQQTGWQEEVVTQRTERAIDFVARLLPEFGQAQCAGTPLFGVQQIPGNDDTLRAADVSFSGERYARLEIVKGSSALEGAMTLVKEWQLVADLDEYQHKTIEQLHPVTLSLNLAQVERTAIDTAEQRGYPASLARYFGHA
ncbi:FAD-dependent oxidoreductase [Vibrio sp. WXL103]|uniref:FAD-dependent oxidoreductase n=1 Tax=Vibrio sp. WXL103 TaxID=3450710 RepID=UPI003EC7C803